MFMNVVPADMIFPWGIIAVFAYVVMHQMLRVPLLWTACFGVWGCSTWWILTAERGWQYLSKFLSVPNWASAQPKYRRFLATSKLKNKKRK
jgi:hypothetical protein